MSNSFKYIKLNATTKKPAHRFKKGAPGAKRYTPEQVEDCPDVGLVIDDGFTAVTLKGDPEHSKKILEVIKEKKTRCMVFDVNEGKELCFIFQYMSPSAKNSDTCCTLLGEHAAVVTGPNKFIQIKTDGQKYPVVYGAGEKPDTLDNIPAYMMATLNPKAERFCFFNYQISNLLIPEVPLTDYIVNIMAMGFSRDVAIECVKFVKERILDAKKITFDMSAVLSDYAIEAAEEKAKEERTKTAKEAIWGLDENGKAYFHHSIAGDYVMNENHVIYFHGNFYRWNSERGIYSTSGNGQNNDDFFNRMLYDLNPEITAKQRAEVASYVRAHATITDEQAEEDPFRLVVKNGVIDINSMTFSRENHKDTPPDGIYDFSQLPINYNPDADPEWLKARISELIPDEKDQMAFWEFMGASLIKSGNFSKSLFLIGPGGTGKSTLFNLAHYMFGQNATSIKLHEFSRRFVAAGLEHKMINIGDDISGASISDDNMIKSIICGMPVMAEEKGKQQFQLRPYATHFYSMNQLFTVNDKSGAFERRFQFIEMKEKFNEEACKERGIVFDKFISEKLKRPEVLSAALNLSLEGAKRLMENNNNFTQSERSRELMEQFTLNNDSCKMWINENGITEQMVINVAADDLYKNFCEWCESIGKTRATTPSRATFYAAIREYFDMDSNMKQRRVDGKRKRYFVKQI